MADNRLLNKLHGIAWLSWCPWFKLFQGSTRRGREVHCNQQHSRRLETAVHLMGGASSTAPASTGGSGAGGRSITVLDDDTTRTTGGAPARRRDSDTRSACSRVRRQTGRGAAVACSAG